MNRQTPRTATSVVVSAQTQSDTGAVAVRVAATAGCGGTGVAATLSGQLQMLDLRLAVTRLVVRDVSPYVSDDEASIDLIVDDVVRLWRQPGQDTGSSSLDGSDGFWNRYADRVEFAPPGHDDEYRTEFCPPGRAISIEDYYRAAWRAHVSQLSAAAEGGAATA